MQIPDYLVWREVEHTLVAGALGLKAVFPDVVIPKLERMCSACWRGYIETWLIDDKDWLRLARVNYYADLIDEAEAPNQLYTLLPNYNSPVAALGFSGDVTAGYGDDVQPHGLFAVSYSNYRVFSFIDGRLSNVQEHDRAWWEKDHKPYKLPDFLTQRV